MNQNYLILKTFCFDPPPLSVIHLTREVAPMTSLQKVEQRYCSHTGQILFESNF
ncbi:hypothetical protein VCRA2116O29_100083 [Vibrio crassostreae]|nr:hypothetical protein VCRA2116O29_100083 [Vibrio crassostreae]CAK2406183.1 hypothetical protein VCRA2119O48_130080 [Vibrio crassostreae]CAK3553388.1 hypothetical protein VCRA2123O74_100029 [Vibrio crassostreae]CAK3750493.1 hypothetical protein VCRA212O16_110030 [Vibrio crassostreae]